MTAIHVLFMTVAYTLPVLALTVLLTEASIMQRLRNFGAHCETYTGLRRLITTPLRALHCSFCTSWWVAAVIIAVAADSCQDIIAVPGTVGGCYILLRWLDRPQDPMAILRSHVEDSAPAPLGSGH